MLIKHIEIELSEYNVVYRQTDKGGVSNARNLALDLSQGEYITFIDDDDYVSPTYLEEMYNIAITGVMPLSNIISFEDGSNKLLPYYITDVYDRIKDIGISGLLTARSYMSVPFAKLIGKEIIGNRRFNRNISIGEDSLFMFCISDKISKFRCTSSDAIYYRRIRENSATTEKKKIYKHFNDYMKKLSFFTLAWIGSPFKYNFPFFISRILGSSRAFIYKIK